MMNEKVLLVGDNPFHGVSHLSQRRSQERDPRITNSQYAGNLVLLAFDNGANGFMFSVSETTLGILRHINKSGKACSLYPTVPAAGDYVRIASKVGIIGIVATVAWQIICTLMANPYTMVLVDL
jgi:hypothetical protein